jgi:transcriptional regulator GlxA family with amidase domain
MASSFYTPRAPLDAFVNFFGLHEGYAAPHQREQVMPVPTLDVVFTLDYETVSLDTLWRTFAATISDQLWEARTAEARFVTLESALLARAGGRVDRHPAVTRAIALFDRSHGALSVGHVVRRTGVSHRRLVELFWNEVGLSPKRYCRVRRFNDVLRQIEPLGDVDWTDVAHVCGYFDQAHFNRDFRAFAGLNPSEYLRHRVARNHVAVPE